MKKLNRKESIAVFVSLVLLAYLFFSGPLTSLFNLSMPNTESQSSQDEARGFQSQDVVVGEGEVAESGDIIAVHYVGKLENGQVFESSVDTGTPFPFQLGVGSVIRGWDEGVAGMRVGGKRILTLPPEYAYGEQGAGPIPPNSTLIFEVELLDVQKAQ